MKAVVAGGTGLIGSHLLQYLEEDETIDEVLALTRREKPNGKKVKWLTVDFDDPNELEKACQGVDIAFCCLGTTMKKAGSKEAFRLVDHDYVIRFGRASKSGGARLFSVVSAIGSDSSSRFFYNRVKGEMERDIESLGFERSHIFHPSILLGSRKEKRIGERVGMIVMQAFAPLMIGQLKKYKPIQASNVARAMLGFSKDERTGNRHFTYEGMCSSQGVL